MRAPLGDGCLRANPREHGTVGTNKLAFAVADKRAKLAFANERTHARVIAVAMSD